MIKKELMEQWTTRFGDDAEAMMEQVEHEVTSAYLIAVKFGTPQSDFNKVFGAAMQGTSDLDCVDSEEFEQRVKREERILDCFTMLKLVVQLQVWW